MKLFLAPMSRSFIFPLLFFVIRFPSIGADATQTITIDSPPPEAIISSHFIAITGRGGAGACFPAQLDHTDLAPICADSSSRFTRLMQLSAGRHELQIAQQRISITIEPPETKPASSVDWELLQPGDILLSHSIGSEQGELYAAKYTHTAIYMGPNERGMALVGEAVIEADAQGLGEVRTVPIENSLVYSRGRTAGIYRPASPLTPAEIDATLAFVRSVVNRARYWNADEDFSLLYSAWALWDQKAGGPRNARRFQLILDQLQARKLSTERFTCASLIWRAYWTGTHGTLDLADPNRARVGGRMANALSASFLARVTPYFVSPDSLLLSGKLREVRQ
jgi:hypothetical protein